MQPRSQEWDAFALGAGAVFGLVLFWIYSRKTAGSGATEQPCPVRDARVKAEFEQRRPELEGRMERLLEDKLNGLEDRFIQRLDDGIQHESERLRVMLQGTADELMRRLDSLSPAAQQQPVDATASQAVSTEPESLPPVAAADLVRNPAAPIAQSAAQVPTALGDQPGAASLCTGVPGSSARVVVSLQNGVSDSTSSRQVPSQAIPGSGRVDRPQRRYPRRADRRRKEVKEDTPAASASVGTGEGAARVLTEGLPLTEMQTDQTPILDAMESPREVQADPPPSFESLPASSAGQAPSAVMHGVPVHVPAAGQIRWKDILKQLVQDQCLRTYSDDVALLWLPLSEEEREAGKEQVTRNLQAWCCSADFGCAL